jgi:aspartate aminotransferase
VPYWVSFKDMVNYSGGVPVFVQTDEENGFSLTAEMVERAITPRTKIILLNSPSNPSGAVMNPEDLKAIAKLAAKRGILVMSDECYSYLDYSGSRFSMGSLTSERENLLIVGSLSKTYSMTGWRLGFALGPKWIIDAMQKLQSQSTSNPTSIVQKAAVAALNGPQDCLVPMREEYVRLRDHIVEGLRAIPGIKCHKPNGAFYVYPNVSTYLSKTGCTSTELASRLLREANVAVVPGEAFGTEEHIRISYPTTMESIDKGLERMRKFFASL